jgi:hypothetical protein
MAVKWAPSWFHNDDKDEEKKDEVKGLPPELEERFKKVDESTSAINERLKGLDSITAFFEDVKKEKEDAKKAAETKNRKDSEPTDEDLAAELLSNPRKAIAEMTSNQSQAILQVMAREVRRQVFEDNASDYEYYTGDVKKEVDALISSQDLKFQNNAASLANAYHTVVGKRFKEIQEGKIKNRFAPSSSSGTVGTKPSKGEDMEIDITPDMIKAARNSGIEIEDFRKLVKKAALAGELEVV